MPLAVQVAAIEETPAVEAIYAGVEAAQNFLGVGQHRLVAARAGVVGAPTEAHVSQFGDEEGFALAVRPPRPVSEDAREVGVGRTVGMDVNGAQILRKIDLGEV